MAAASSPGVGAGLTHVFYLARFAITIFALGGLFALYSLGLPVYWKLYADVIRPFQTDGIQALDDDPFSAALLQHGEGGVQHVHAAIQLARTRSLGSAHGCVRGLCRRPLCEH